MNKKTVSITMWEEQALLIHRAAESLGVSDSEFIRAATVPAAAAQLGIEPPQFQSFDPPRFRRGVVSQAAELMGLTVEQFKNQISKKAAADLLDEMTNPSKSGERLAPVQQATGTYHYKPTR